MNILEKMDMYLVEMTKKKFESQIRKFKNDKNKLENLKSTIQGMVDGMMLSKKDGSDLTNQINSLL